MKISGNESATSIPGLTYSDGSYEPSQGGLTIRQHFAAMAMQGLLANPDYNCPSEPKKMATVDKTAAASIDYADALINELNKTDYAA